MERIQSAIQKARKARGDYLPEDLSNSAVSETVLDHPKQDDQSVVIDKAWAALPDQEFDSRALGRMRVVTHEAGEQSGTFDGMRTRMLQEMRKNGWRRVALTSPGSDCGKSTVGLNLAFGLARQQDMRTMLIDLDMRQPSVCKILNMHEDHAFASALVGECAPEDQMVCYKDKLAIATNQKPVRNPSELLQSKGAARVIDGLEERYKPDVMIFDTPPLLTCDDTVAFLDQIDCVLLIAAAELTTADEIKKCAHEISVNSNLLGVVLNKCRYLDQTQYTYGV